MEDGEWWMLGVKPGAFAASGANWNEAYLNFRQTLIKTLHDSATLTNSYETFEADVNAVMQEHGEERERWDAARRRLREGAAVDDAGLAELPRLTRVVEPGVSVRRLDTCDHYFTPSDNNAPELPQLTAA
jgi:hypothetical protein